LGILLHSAIFIAAYQPDGGIGHVGTEKFFPELEIKHSFFLGSRMTEFSQSVGQVLPIVPSGSMILFIL
jgi:hypothetical protein